MCFQRIDEINEAKPKPFNTGSSTQGLDWDSRTSLPRIARHLISLRGSTDERIGSFLILLLLILCLIGSCAVPKKTGLETLLTPASFLLICQIQPQCRTKEENIHKQKTSQVLQFTSACSVCRDPTPCRVRHAASFYETRVQWPWCLHRKCNFSGVERGGTRHNSRKVDTSSTFVQINTHIYTFIYKLKPDQKYLHSLNIVKQPGQQCSQSSENHE